MGYAGITERIAEVCRKMPLVTQSEGQEQSRRGIRGGYAQPLDKLAAQRQQPPLRSLEMADFGHIQHFRVPVLRQQKHSGKKMMRVEPSLVVELAVALPVAGTLWNGMEHHPLPND